MRDRSGDAAEVGDRRPRGSGAWCSDSRDALALEILTQLRPIAEYWELRGVPGEDLAQETTLKALDGLDRDSVDRERLAGWLLRTMRRGALDYLRAQARECRAIEALTWCAGSAQFTDDSPVDCAVRAEAHRKLGRALSRLPAPQRVVIRLRFFRDRTWVEIATKIGGSARSAQRCAQSGLWRLRGALESSGRQGARGQSRPCASESRKRHIGAPRAQVRPRPRGM
jgi:RNA polymerase sigma factor (sigma-70 family)